LTRNWKCK